MVRIVKRGKIPELKQIKVDCPKCGSVLEVKRNELKSERDRNDLYYHLTCPVCQNEVNVDINRFNH